MLFLHLFKLPHNDTKRNQIPTLATFLLSSKLGLYVRIYGNKKLLRWIIKLCLDYMRSDVGRDACLTAPDIAICKRLPAMQKQTKALRVV